MLATSPCYWTAAALKVASQQSLILRHGKAKNTLVLFASQALTKGPHSGTGSPSRKRSRPPHMGVAQRPYHANGSKRKISGVWGRSPQQLPKYAKTG